MHMATLETPFEFTGKIGNLTAYKMKGTGKTVIRKAAGHSRKRLKTAPEFIRTRENNSEFKACTSLTAGIRKAIFPLVHMGDTQFTGALNRLSKQIQLLDTEHERGQRSVQLSRYRHMLRGFSINLPQPFDGFLRHPLQIQTLRNDSAAVITIPAIIPGVNLFLPPKGAFYRFVACLGVVSDVAVADTARSLAGFMTQSHATPWEHPASPVPETGIRLQIPGSIPESDSLILGIGVEMGQPDRFGEILPVKYSGAAKVLEVY